MSAYQNNSGWITDIEVVQTFAALGMIREGDLVKICRLKDIAGSPEHSIEGEYEKRERHINRGNGALVDEGYGGTIETRVNNHEGLPYRTYKQWQHPCVCHIQGWYLAAFNIIAWRPTDHPVRHEEEQAE